VQAVLFTVKLIVFPLYLKLTIKTGFIKQAKNRYLWLAFLTMGSQKLNTCRYYDVVNFTKQLKVPGFYSWGFNDDVCPPTSMYAAYNSISSPKELVIYKETGHATVPEQRENMTRWLLSKLKQ